MKTNFQLSLALELVSFFKLFKGDVTNQLNTFVEAAKSRLDQYGTIEVMPAGSGFEQLFLSHIDEESNNMVNTDADFMIVRKEYVVLEHVQETVPSENLCKVTEHETTKNSTFLHMRRGTHDGYVCLSFISVGSCKESTESVNFLENFKFIEESRKSYDLTDALGQMQSLEGNVHGPSFQEHTIGSIRVSIDWVFTIKCDFWPSQAKEWINRPRLGSWPSIQLIQSIVSKGCHVVPVDSHSTTIPGKEWRLSFSLAELTLIKSMEEDLKFAYCILKLVIKFKMEMFDVDVFASYHLKTALFWYLEAFGEHYVKTLSTVEKIYGLLDMLIQFYSDNCINNYFVRTNNMIDHCSAGDILNTLKCLKSIQLNLSTSLYDYIDNNQKLPILFDNTILEQVESLSVFSRACKYHFLVMSLVGLLIDSNGEKDFYSYHIPVQVLFKKSEFLHKLSFNDGDDLKEISRQYLCLNNLQTQESVTIQDILKLLDVYLSEDSLKVTESSAVALGVFNVVLTLHPDIMRLSERECHVDYMQNKDFFTVLCWSAATHKKHCNEIYEFVAKVWKDPPLLWCDDVDAIQFIQLLMVVLGKPTKQAKAVTGSLLKNAVFDIFTWRGFMFYLLHVSLDCAYIVCQVIAYLLDKPVFDEIHNIIKFNPGATIKQRAIDLVLGRPELKAELTKEEFSELTKTYK